jgi:hypothetical protein
MLTNEERKVAADRAEVYPVGNGRSFIVRENVGSYYLALEWLKKHSDEWGKG